MRKNRGDPIASIDVSPSLEFFRFQNVSPRLLFSHLHRLTRSRRPLAPPAQARLMGVLELANLIYVLASVDRTSLNLYLTYLLEEYYWSSET